MNPFEGYSVMIFILSRVDGSSCLHYSLYMATKGANGGGGVACPPFSIYFLKWQVRGNTHAISDTFRFCTTSDGTII